MFSLCCLQRGLGGRRYNPGLDSRYFIVDPFSTWASWCFSASIAERCLSLPLRHKTGCLLLEQLNSVRREEVLPDAFRDSLFDKLQGSFKPLEQACFSLSLRVAQS